jgi:hypothetical protein
MLMLPHCHKAEAANNAHLVWRNQRQCIVASAGVALW